MRILGVCGTLSATSANLGLLDLARASAPAGVEVVVFDGLGRLPLFNPDVDAAGDPPPAVAEWRAALAARDAVLIASPEYGHSLTGVLKNAIDWTIGSGELHDKVVGLTAAVPHPERGRMGLAAVRQTLGAVSARIVGGAPIVRGPTFQADVAALLERVVEVASAGPDAAQHTP